eukprot:TRINITY_DN1404_c0_g1_i17.p1 TRINITY_DN1404_c0_g1~~TRINITY_DN1404_c0_g1_i17.p1  ORF type:complete len:132 (+),score=30.59 TRINITY_DN1404_c0_g1_i17:891-1286(+)
MIKDFLFSVTWFFGLSYLLSAMSIFLTSKGQMISMWVVNEFSTFLMMAFYLYLFADSRLTFHPYFFDNNFYSDVDQCEDPPFIELDLSYKELMKRESVRRARKCIVIRPKMDSERADTGLGSEICVGYLMG